MPNSNSNSLDNAGLQKSHSEKVVDLLEGLQKSEAQKTQPVRKDWGTGLLHLETGEQKGHDNGFKINIVVSRKVTMCG